MIVCQYDTAVVVLSYNGKSLHELFFPELVAESIGKYDVVLIDNASTDGTLDYVTTHFPTVKTIRIETNRGFASGYYEGLKQVSAKYYVLLSADFEITERWFNPLYKLMQDNPHIGACQPKIKYYKDKALFEYAGAGGGFMDKWGYMFCRGRIFFTIEKDVQQYDDTIEVFWAGGGCCFVRAELYHRVGGLDTDLYAHMEEIDLCWRMINSGSKIVYCGQSTVYHIGGSVISYGSPAKLFYNYRNNLALLVKNVPLSRLWWLLPWRLLLDGAAGLRALTHGDFKEFRAILRAHGNFYRTFPKWWRKRGLNGQLPDTMATYSAVYQKSIIVQYFAKRHKQFSSLAWSTLKIAKPE
jgi:GT2 family glycosyltransferase